MYYNDHLAAAGKKKRSRLCNLVDTAIKLDEIENDCLSILAEKGQSKRYKTVFKEESHKSFNYLLDAAFMFSEEEERRLHAGKENSKSLKTISEEEESQTRYSSVVKSSVTRRQAYDSCSSLNEIPTDSETEAFQNNSQWLSSPLFMMTKILKNYPRSEPMVYDEEQGAEKEEYVKTISEDSEKRLLDPLHQEPRSSLKNFFTKTYKRNLKKPNRVSTSSSLLNTAESEKTETKRRKRRSVTQRMSSGKSKKAKVASFSQTARETPEWLVEAMREMKGAQDPKLILERTLSASDVNSGQSRLLIPFKKLLRNDFLTRAECGAIEKVAVTKKDEENTGVGTILVSQRSGMWGLRFKKWVMKKKSGNGTLSYALNWDWNSFVERNNLKAGDKIRLWTFRCRGVLCFGLETE